MDQTRQPPEEDRKEAGHMAEPQTGPDGNSRQESGDAERGSDVQPPTEGMEAEESDEADEEVVPVLPALAENIASRINLRLSPMAIQWLVGIAAFALIAFQLGTQNLFETSEARYASVARAMADGGSLLRPQLNGVSHFTKPPLTYWAGALGIKLFGPTEQGVKAFLPVAAALTAVGCYRIGLLLTTVRSALCATIVLLTSLFFAVQFRGLTADPLLAMFETWMIWALIRYRTKPSNALATGFWALAGFAFLTKGPPGLLPLLGLIPGIALRGGGESIKALLKHVTGWAAFGVIGLGWYLWMGYNVPGLFRYFIFDETIARVASEAHGRTGPIFYFALVMIAGMFPWTAFFAGGVVQNFREAQAKDQPWGLPVFLWFAVSFIVLSLARSKLAPYALPLLVPASLMTGGYLSNLFSYDNEEPFAYKLESALTIIFFAFLGVTIMTMSFMGALPDPKIARVAFFIAFYFMFLAVFGYTFMNLGIVKGIILVLGVTVPGIMLMLLPTINGDEILLKERPLPGYRKLLRRVAALPPNARILFAKDVLEGARFYTGRDIPTWGVKRETRFEPRSEKLVLFGDELLRTMAAPDLYLLMRRSARDAIRTITQYSIDEVEIQGKWGLYLCGRSLTDSELSALPAPALAPGAAPGAPMEPPVYDIGDIAGTGSMATPGIQVPFAGRTPPVTAHIDAISSTGTEMKLRDPAAADWVAAMASRGARLTVPGETEKSAPKPASKTSPVAQPKPAPKHPLKPAPKPDLASATQPVQKRPQNAPVKPEQKPAEKPVPTASPSKNP